MAHTIEVIPSHEFLPLHEFPSGPQWRLLAEGDSWFSIGDLNPRKNGTLLSALALSQRAAAVNCAQPGDELRLMVKMRDPFFVRLIAGKDSWRWEAIVLSAGGNDLIEAARTRTDAQRHQRLLLLPAEWGPQSQGPARYLCAEGWQTFERYLQANLKIFLELRDRKGGDTGNRGRPVCMHTYAYATPRPSGAGLGNGPWLLPAMRAYGIPPTDWNAVARLLIDRLAELMLACAADPMQFPQLHVFDTRQVPIDPAQPGDGRASGDWANEIHLLRSGYHKLARAWSPEIERVIVANP